MSTLSLDTQIELIKLLCDLDFNAQEITVILGEVEISNSISQGMFQAFEIRNARLIASAECEESHEKHIKKINGCSHAALE